MPSSLYTISASKQDGILKIDIKRNVLVAMLLSDKTKLDHEIEHKRGT